MALVTSYCKRVVVNDNRKMDKIKEDYTVHIIKAWSFLTCLTDYYGQRPLVFDDSITPSTLIHVAWSSTFPPLYTHQKKKKNSKMIMSNEVSNAYHA